MNLPSKADDDSRVLERNNSYSSFRPQSKRGKVKIDLMEKREDSPLSGDEKQADYHSSVHRSRSFDLLQEVESLRPLKVFFDVSQAYTGTSRETMQQR